jgi:hypothetical protein
MEVTFDLITGISFGLEFVPADAEVDVPYPCIVVDFACFRWIIEFVTP